MLACLLEFGADINTKSWDGYTALIKASINGNIALIEFLIQNGADINTKTKHGFTALHYAARVGKNSVVKLLVTEGAGVNVRDKIGTTPLMYLSRNGYINMVTNLIKEDMKITLSSSTFLTSVKGDWWLDFRFCTFKNFRILKIRISPIILFTHCLEKIVLE